MHDRMGSGPTPRPVTAYPHNLNPTEAASPTNDNNALRPLSLVTDPSSSVAAVEDSFFARGLAEDQAALAEYASFSGLVRRRVSALGRRYGRALLIGGGAAALFLAVSGLHRMGSRDRLASSQAANCDPVPALPTSAAPPSAAPALARVEAPAVLPNPGSAAPAAEPSAASAQPGAAEAGPVPLQPSTPPSGASTPEELTAAPQAAELPAKGTVGEPGASAVAVAPAVAAPAAPAPAAEPAASPSNSPTEQIGIAAQAAPSPAEPAATRPAATPPPEAQAPEACREAIKKRDTKAVTATCEAALASDATLARPLLGFAKAQLERGRSAVAATWARKILQVDDSLADAYLIVGTAEQEARRPSAAKAAYQRYLELAPRGAYANDVRSSLNAL